MRNILCLAAVGIVCVLAAGCADPYEDAVKEQIELLKEVNAILDSVKDAESLEDAEPKLAEVGKKMREAAKRQKNLEPPSKDKAEFLKAKYEKEMREVANKMLSNLTSLATIEGGGDIGYLFKSAAPKAVPKK